MLRVLYQAGVALSPDSVVANLEAPADESHDRGTVDEALSGPEDAELIRRLDRAGDYYEVTDRGGDYVETEVDQEAVGFSG